MEKDELNGEPVIIKGWRFDLFKALDTLDEDNRQAIAWWLKHPAWP